MDCILTRLRLEQIVTEGALPAAPPALMETMEQYGQMDPVHVRPLGRESYALTFGEPCLASAYALRWESLAAIVETRELVALPGALRVLVLDQQRQSLTLLHRARLARTLVEKERYKQCQVAGILDVGDAMLSRMLSVVRCPDLEEVVEREGLVFSAAMELTALEEAPRREYLVEVLQEKRGRKKFPTVAEIRRGVWERQGKQGLPELEREMLLPFLSELLGNDGVIEWELAAGRRATTRVQFIVPRAQLEATAKLIERLRRAAAAGEV